MRAYKIAFRKISFRFLMFVFIFQKQVKLLNSTQSFAQKDNRNRIIKIAYICTIAPFTQKWYPVAKNYQISYTFFLQTQKVVLWFIYINFFEVIQISHFFDFFFQNCQVQELKKIIPTNTNFEADSPKNGPIYVEKLGGMSSFRSSRNVM